MDDQHGENAQAPTGALPPSPLHHLLNSLPYWCSTMGAVGIVLRPHPVGDQQRIPLGPRMGPTWAQPHLRSYGAILRRLPRSSSSRTLSPRASRPWQAGLLPPDALIRIRKAAGWSPQECGPCPQLRAQPGGELLHTPLAPLRRRRAALPLPDALIRIRQAAGRSPQEWGPCPQLGAQPGWELLHSVHTIQAQLR